MAQLAISLAGAAIGFALGGPTGAQVGWAAGSLIASGLGPGTQGPRLSDTKVQVSSYGATLGIVYGAYRKAGNVIWSTDLKEEESEEGGKGGPSVTTYTYSVSCAVAICEGVQGGVRRIWADAKLVYDASEDADGATKAASSKFAEYFTFYPGSEDQMPDPTIEADRGAGKVPAYRGTCYVVFTDLPLADYGNRIPNFSFEVTAETVTSTEQAVIAPLVMGPWIEVNGIPQHGVGLTKYTIEAVGGTPAYETFDLADAIAHLDSGYTTFIGYFTYTSQVLSTFGKGTDVFDGAGAQYVFLAFNRAFPDHVVWNGLTEASGFAGCTSFQMLGIPSTNTESWMLSAVGFYAASGVGGPLRITKTNVAPDAGYVVANNCINYPPNPDDGTFPVMWVRPHRLIRAERVLTMREKTCYPAAEATDGIFEAPGNPDVCITSDGEVFPNATFELVQGPGSPFRQLQYVSYTDFRLTQYPMGPVVYADDPRANDAAFWNAAAAKAGIDGSFPGDFPVPVSDAAVGTYTIDAAPEGEALLSDIVRDICLRTPLTEDQVNVSALADVVVKGFQVSSQMAARNALAPLAQAFFFDVVESGDQLRFVKRGQATVARIGRDHLGAGEETAADAFAQHTRAQETELPATVNVAYAAIAADYENGTQTAKRRVTGSQQVLGVELPIVLTDQQAAEIAAVLLYDLWTSRTQRTITLTRAWSHLEPTDVIEFTDGSFDYRVRAGDIEQNGPVITVLCHDSDPASYSPEAQASPTPGGGNTVTFVGPTRLEVLDLPLLRDADDTYGVYAAASGYLDTWAGARVFRSFDGGASYNTVRDMTRRAIMGRAENVVGNHLGGNTVDEANALTVRMTSGELQSITRDELLNNGNTAALGNEVIQFQRAEQLGPKLYRLTGLLRGRLGTERHMATHTVGERFVLLTEATLYRLPDNIAFINTEQVYKAVTIGLSLEDATEVPAVNAGTSLKPLSPAHLKVIRQFDGSYAVSWIRRTRYDGSWLPTVDVPLGEASEQYLVEVLDGDVVEVSRTVTSPSTVIGEAETSYVMEETATLSYPVWMGREVSGAFFGLVVRNVNDDPKRIVRIQANGIITEGPPMGSQVFQAVHGNDRMYVITTDPLNPTLYSFTYNNPTTAAATRTSTNASDFGGVAYDGQNVWLAVRSTNQLLRLDPISLDVEESFAFDWQGDSPNAIYADQFFDAGAAVWALVDNDIVRWSLDTHAEVDRVTTGCVDLADIVLTPTLIFALDGSGEARVEVYDRATLTLQHTHEVGAYAPVYPGHYGRVFGDYVLVADIERFINVFDVATGELLGRASIATNARDVAGVLNGEIVITGSPTNNYLNVTSARYLVREPLVAEDLTGKVIRVSQVSAVVGPGFPATWTITD